MAPTRTSTLNEALALLDDPAPTDFDPEALPDSDGGDEQSGSESGSNDDDVDRAREHYVAVGKSKLRSGGEPEALGKAYVGERVSRQDIYDTETENSEESFDEADDVDDGMPWGDMEIGSDEEIDSDDAMGSEDEKRYAGWNFKGSTTTRGGAPPKAGDRVTGSSDLEDDEEEEEDMDDEDDDDDQSDVDSDSGSQTASDDDEDEDAEESDDSADAERRKKLSALLSAESSAVTNSLATATVRDAEKGAAVLSQQRTFDTLLSTRIKLQRALTSVNSLPASTPSNAEAEAAVLCLWNSISSLRAQARKRKHAAITQDTPIDEVWGLMEAAETSADAHRAAVLEKWAAKTRPVTVEKGGKLDNSVPRSVMASVQDSLATDYERLVKRTRGADEESVEVFDDADFYAQLLKALVDARMMEGGGSTATEVMWREVQKSRKKKKVVDTRASKGRKMRYTVHEKLAGFMAPMEGWNRWGDEQTEALFSSLLGQRAAVDEDELNLESEDEIETGGVRLFR